MAVRFRKSIKIAPGLKLNLNKKSMSLTAGTKNVHYTVNSSGRRTVSTKVPGTGVYVTESYNKKAKNKKHSSPSPKTVNYTAPEKPAASPAPSQSTEKHVSNKTGLIIMRMLFALVAIGGAFILTYGAPVIGGIIFAVGAFLFWVALKMKPEDLNNDPKEEEDTSEES